MSVCPSGGTNATVLGTSGGGWGRGGALSVNLTEAPQFPSSATLLSETPLRSDRRSWLPSTVLGVLPPQSVSAADAALTKEAGFAAYPEKTLRAPIEAAAATVRS